MARILSIDYGLKRCGIAVTDPLQIIVNGLTTVDTIDIDQFIINYCKENLVDKIVIGYPYQNGFIDNANTKAIILFKENLQNLLQPIEVLLSDEKNSSADASKILYQSGMPKKQRRNKGLIDKISAVVILQRYLGHI